MAAFGAPKDSTASLSTKHKTVRKSVINQSINTNSLTNLTPMNAVSDEGMSMMTNVVYQEESGPGAVEEEQVSRVREFSATRNADKSTRKMRLDAQ